MNSNPLSSALERLAAGGPLRAAECQDAVGSILDGGTPEAATAAFLTALHIKGENAEELLGAVRAIRQRMICFDPDPAAGFCLDTCGTGGDGANTVNVSTATAIVVAACGVRVVKHGNRAATGRSGSSEVLDRLGIAVDVDPSVLRQCLDELGIAFLFAPRFHPGLRGIAPVRRQLSFRTIFNLAGPLCNPANPTHQLVGVPTEEHAELISDVLARVDQVQRALVVTGSDGLDEVTLDGSTQARIVESGLVREELWNPEDFGLRPVHAAELTVAGPEKSADLLLRMFDGEPGPVREIVLANSAAALWTISPCPLPQAVHRAALAIDSGAAARLVERWSELTRREDKAS
jgi:anthranilate phosphoribosyltransferase